MPKEFYSSIALETSTGVKLATLPLKRSCRDAWFSALCRQAKNSQYTPSQEIVSSRTTLWIDEEQEEEVLRLCAAIRDRWYPSIKLTTGFVESESIFIDSRYELQVESEGTAAIGAMWWLILLDRLHMRNREEFDIDNLVKKSPSAGRELWYNSHGDKDDHVALLSVFHTVSDAKLWLDLHLRRDGGCYGPNNYLSLITG